MHAFTHSLAHRAPSVTRPRVRWQPYNPLSSQASSSLSSQSPSSHCSTPSSSLSSPPSSTPNSNSKLCSHTQNPKETSLPRESSKKQFAVGLVDQAVKTLGDVWRPQDIPLNFHAFPHGGGPASCGLSDPNSIINASGDIHVPIKGFVHEVIRRSRTSGCVLQTALCYIEAVRPKIPDLAKKEQACEGSTGQRDTCRVTPATAAEISLEEQYIQMDELRLDVVGDSSVSYSGLQSSDAPNPDQTIATVRISDIDALTSESAGAPYPDHVPSNSSSTCLPSPLLCPRRTFLASLILASKFTQDKCYSNRAWAKLSGLPAREIGRCERALGEALEWRLWVGKTPVQPPSNSGSTANPSVGRPVVKSQSESNILNTPTTRSPFLVRQDSRPPVTCINPQRMLQRSSTMPTEVFANFAKSDVRPEASNGHSKLYLNPIESTVPSSPLHFKQPQEQFDYQLASTSDHVSASYAEMVSQSPSPDNPGLSYSPSSTESSSGDRTVQMSTFIDEPTALYSVSQPPTAVDFWPCSGNNDSQGRRFSPLLFVKNREMPFLNSIGSLAPAPNGDECLRTFGLVASSSNPPWVSEGEISQSLLAQPMVGQVM
ncbi:hypothetical protein Agabi119p4_1714 [Agaricus bisporus var. burnettii]|uniref:Cyclin N-terminal domain-containing protein n=1 Tax=Agaricus bisporus var. burnettii TaxID=192524 RepID=A0A8H7F7U5_AGABI|nr:hypothetical protein Agabi119p4_1714 [Agaricus bisporus var. burnettii]